MSGRYYDFDPGSQSSLNSTAINRIEQRQARKVLISIVLINMVVLKKVLKKKGEK